MISCPKLSPLALRLMAGLMPAREATDFCFHAKQKSGIGFDVHQLWHPALVQAGTNFVRM
jgi:hypothetical protein